MTQAQNEQIARLTALVEEFSKQLSDAEVRSASREDRLEKQMLHLANKLDLLDRRDVFALDRRLIKVEERLMRISWIVWSTIGAVLLGAATAVAKLIHKQ